MKTLRHLAARVTWRHAVVFLFVLAWLLAGGAYWQAVQYYHRGQAAQQAQGQAFEKKLCTTLSGLAALAPPAGTAAADPSRTYLLRQHRLLAELVPDVGCPR